MTIPLLSAYPLVYDVTDHTGEKTRHLAVNKEAAIQAHMIHFGLFSLQEEPEVSDGISLSKFRDRRDTICWDLNCCMAAMSRGIDISMAIKTTSTTDDNDLIKCDAGGPDKDGKYAGRILLNNAGKWYSLSISEPIYDSAEEAILAMQGIVDRIRAQPASYRTKILEEEHG